MKKFGVCAILSVSALCVLLLLSPQRVYADSVTLTSISFGPHSGNWMGADVYPYEFSVNGTSTVPLMCLSFESDVFIGESWKANTELATASIQFEEAAYIFSQIGTAGAETVNWANWKLFDPSLTDAELLATGLSSLEVSNIDSLLNSALTNVPGNPNLINYSDYLIYVPVDGSQPEGDSTPQILIGEVTPTPEPDSLVLFGSGLLGLAALLFMRKCKGLGALSTGA